MRENDMLRPPRPESGVTAIEYSLIAALIAIAIISSVLIVGDQIGITYSKIANEVDSAIE